MKKICKLGFLLLVLLGNSVWAGNLKFELKLDDDILYTKVHETGVIIAVTQKSINGVDAESGKLLWSSRMPIKLAKGAEFDPNDLSFIENTPFVIFEDKEGPGMGFQKYGIICKNIVSGEDVWRLNGDLPNSFSRAFFEGQDAENGSMFATWGIATFVPDYINKQVYILANAVAYRSKNRSAKNRVDQFFGWMAIDMESGECKWISEHMKALGKDLYKAGIFKASPAKLVGDKIIWDQIGLYVFSAKNGQILNSLDLSREFKAKTGLVSSQKLQGMNAVSIEYKGIFYMVVQDQIHAYDINNGLKLVWMSPKMKANIPDMQIVGDYIVARTGGQFTYMSKPIGSPNKVPNTVDVEPRGVAIYELKTGKQLRHTEELHKKKKMIASTTQLLIEDGVAYFGTKNSLRALDIEKKDYKYVVELDNVESNTPLNLQKNKQGEIILNTNLGCYAFEASTGKLIWKTLVPKPELPLADKLAMAAATMVSAMASAQASYNNTMYGGYDNYRAAQTASNSFSSTIAGLDRLRDRLTAGVSATDQNINMVMTGKTKDPIIKGININTGQIEAEVQLKGREPEYITDEYYNIMVTVMDTDSKTLKVFSLK